jgi:DNA-binding CsgD family transcriptional regulator
LAVKPFVYFIRNGHGNVKIGVTARPESRIYSLAQASDTPLELVRTVDGGRRAEAWFHDRFSEYRIYGEWFRFVPEMMTAEADLRLPDEQVSDARRGAVIPIDVYRSMAADGRSQVEIATTLGVSRQAVNQSVKRYGIETKSGKRAADTTHDADVLLLTEAGKTAMEIASTLSMGAGKVRIILRRRGIKANKPTPKSKYASDLQKLAASGLCLADAASALGIHPPAAHKLAVRLGVKFADGRKMKQAKLPQSFSITSTFPSNSSDVPCSA